MSGFHQEGFDPATQLKLEIVRGYVREWLPVFLSRGSFPEIGIFDFFCGPGEDGNGVVGSPVIIVEEVAKYMRSPNIPHARGVNIRLFFNDNDRKKIASLKRRVESQFPDIPFPIQYTSLDYTEALERGLDFMRRRDTAALAVLDPFGFAVNKDVFLKLVQCPAVDILFFIPSNILKRFASQPAIENQFQLPLEEVEECPHVEVHRFVCNGYYRRLIPFRTEYFLAPFSLKKESSPNVYGLIFGSGNLSGLEKFLRVSWRQDPTNGEANFNINQDYAYEDGQIPFEDEELCVTTKRREFRKRLRRFISKKPRDNREVYRFTLEEGFLPAHAKEELRKLCEKEKLVLERIGEDNPSRSPHFYLSWKNYREGPKVRFLFKDSQS